MKYTIMGAGPAGLSTAIGLAKKGYSVDVFEETLTIGGHTGDNIQAMRSYGRDKGVLEKLKNEGLKLKSFNPIFEVRKYSPSNRCDVLYSKNDPIFYTFKRGIGQDSLENQLATQAQDEGVNIFLGRKAKIIDVNVVAGGSKFDPVGMGFGAVFENSSFDKKTISFFFGNKHIPQGYGYVAPYDQNNLTIAITSFRKSGFKNIKKNFFDFIRTNPIIKEILKDAQIVNQFSGYGHFNIPKTAVHKHKYFVGGSAGFVDPARGFGVKYALFSGLLAAKAITSNADYDKLWQEEFKSELMNGFSRRLLLNKLKLADYEKFVSEKRLSIDEYEKIPSSLKNALLDVKASIRIGSWKKKFNYDLIFDL